ncbi:hypothetical protein OAI47_03570 [Rhodospirillaceae bacterium]|nr:hypothetical protein [Rhodospirillaceae bacterium]
MQTRSEAEANGRSRLVEYRGRIYSSVKNLCWYSHYYRRGLVKDSAKQEEPAERGADCSVGCVGGCMEDF